VYVLCMALLLILRLLSLRSVVDFLNKNNRVNVSGAKK